MEPVLVHETPVYGVETRLDTRCAHYHSEIDIIAIQFRCCKQFFPCHLCHDALMSHPATQWPTSEFDTPAILCGHCGNIQSISSYLLAADARCPKCHAAFNPGCKTHRHFYFE